MFAVAATHTPLFTIPNFPEEFQNCPLICDSIGLFRPLERIALKGTKFRLTKQIDDTVWQVRSNEFVETLYTDIRFVERVSEDFPERVPVLPSKDKIFSYLYSRLGEKYIWGGNCHEGIPEMLSFYPPTKPLSPIEEKNWSFKGIDCSGLIYEACDGFIPRNTAELVTFGTQIPIENKSISEIAKLTKPLDILVYKGHVVIVLDSKTIIESRAVRKEVFTLPLEERLESLMQEKKVGSALTAPEDYASHFFLRRWIK